MCSGHYDKQWKASVNGRLPDDIRCEMPGCNNKKADKSEICSHCIKKLNRENDKYYRANVDLHITEEGIFSTLPPSLAKEIALAVLHWIELSNL